MMEVTILIFGLHLAYGYTSVGSQVTAGNITLTCRSCHNAVSLHDCIGKETCRQNEQCYLDAVITSELRILYNGGCRSSSECYGPGHSSGKRVDFFNVLACSRCCGNELQNADLSVADMECNTNLCGIKPGTAAIKPTTTLTCQSCHNAATLNDCIGHVTCKHNEQCYMDAFITPHNRVLYNGGCRTTTECIGSVLGSGKRTVIGNVLACSRCCSTTPQTSSPSHVDMECNAMLCGIRTGDSTLTCRSCYNATSLSNCTGEENCKANEFCRATTSSMAGNTVYNFGCYNKLNCQFLTKTAIIQYGPASITLGLSNGVGRKRQSVLCDVCCGDNFCNNDECNVVREQLIQYANASQLDFNTLRQKL